MSDRLDRDDIAAQTVLITFSPPALLDEYQRRRALSMPILSDADRSTYRAYGFGRGSLRDVWGMATLRRYAEILRSSSDSRVRAATTSSSTKEDTRQLGGDMVIAPDGTLAWGFWGSGPADRPDPEQLVAVLAELGPGPDAGRHDE